MKRRTPQENARNLMSLEQRRPIYNAGRVGRDVLLQRFSWVGHRQFNYQFTVMLAHNTEVVRCEENTILDGPNKSAALGNAQKLFDKVMRQLRHDLNTF